LVNFGFKIAAHEIREVPGLYKDFENDDFPYGTRKLLALVLYSFHLPSIEIKFEFLDTQKKIH
jgi:hypothetical protein